MVRGTLVIAASFAALSLAACSVADTNPQATAGSGSPSSSASPASAASDSSTASASSAAAGSATPSASGSSTAAAAGVASSAASNSTAATPSTPEPLKPLALESAGYKAKTGGSEFPADAPFPLKVAITGKDGKNVTAFETDQGAAMNVFLVRWDISRLARVPVTMAPDGIWTGTAPPLDSGQYRVVAQFTPAGAQDSIVVGKDVVIGDGSFIAEIPKDTLTATIDGYQAKLAAAPSGKGPSTVSVTVTQAGKPVTAVDSFMGGGASMVLLSDSFGEFRSEASQPDAAGNFKFALPALPPASYQVFLQMSMGGKVRTFPLGWTTG